jgi:Fur family ferric uptake transcriptional regulator
MERGLGGKHDATTPLEAEMKRGAVTASVDAPDVDAAIAVLRNRGLRASTARRLVLETLYMADRLLTADEIAGGLGGRLPRSDPASVYRILDLLEEVGLVRHLSVGRGPGLYARSDGPQREYLMCEVCGSLREIEPTLLDSMRAVTRRRLGHEPRFTRFPMAGICTACAERRRDDRPRR